MSNLAETNQFIDLFEKLYDAVYISKGSNNGGEESNLGNIETITSAPAKKSIFSKIFKSDSSNNHEAVGLPYNEILTAYEAIKNFLDNILSNPAQSFWTIWNICQFVRWAEKIFLYRNDPETDTIFVDSEMTADEREFMFKVSDITLSFKLQLIKKPDAKITESAYNEVITIMVERNFGKQMKTKIISVDSDVDLTEESDIYLINQINRYLNSAIRELMVDIINKIMEPVSGKVVMAYDFKPISKGYYYKL